VKQRFEYQGKKLNKEDDKKIHPLKHSRISNKSLKRKNSMASMAS